MSEPVSVIDADPDAPFRPVRFGDVGLEVETRPNGTLILSARAPLVDHDSNLLRVFWAHGNAMPDQTWIARRGGENRDWQPLSYARGRADVSAVAAWLFRQEIAPGRCVLVLSENSVAHAAWMFGAIAAGVPICSVSVNYSLLGTDFERLRHVVDLVKPAVIFAEQGAPFAGALAAVRPADTIVVSAQTQGLPGMVVALDDILSHPDVEAVGERIQTLDPTVPARYLLTSGSTGRPKAVIHTQAMMTANTASGFQAMGDAFAWDGACLDWLPWSHIAGSSLLTNITALGGSLYIDDGRPTPELFGETLRNLKEVRPRFYGTMPSGYAMLADALDLDDALRHAYFADLRCMLFGGAGLPQPLHDRMQALAVRTIKSRIQFVSGYGSTETGSAISYTWWETRKVGIGLPVPGTSLKLVPADGVYEVRVKAPSVTPGYLGDPARTAEAFDEEGFLRMEDRADFHDRASPSEGLFFAGRSAEQFKLANGTFVAAGRLRDSVLKACPGLFRDLVVCGEGQGELTVLAWPDAEVMARSGPETIRLRVLEGMLRHNLDNPGQSARLKRLMLLTDPPSAEHHEVSDKGSINRAAVLRRRAGDLARLYDGGSHPDVIEIR